MADNAVTITARLGLENGEFKTERNPGRLTADQTTLASVANIQTIGITYEAIALGDVTTEGWCYLRNLDAANFVDVGTDGGAALVPCMRLLAGEVALFRISTNALFALADTAPCQVDVMIFEA
jgi:hypothetical protein